MRKLQTWKNRCVPLVFVSAYFSTYLSVRIEDLLIHRKTWKNSWNRHSITTGAVGDAHTMWNLIDENHSGETEDNAEWSEVIERYRHQAVFQNRIAWFFAPLRWSEAALWYVFDPQDTP